MALREIVFPLLLSQVSAPQTWSEDQGVDMAAPGHAAEFAVWDGVMVRHGITGFGPWAPVIGLTTGDYVYYGHAGPGNWVPSGRRFHAGEVISEVGAGIVGISTGPHIEIGFCDAYGTPDRARAHEMHLLLIAAYDARRGGGRGRPGGPTAPPPFLPAHHYDPAAQIEEAWGVWGLHGRRAYTNSQATAELVNQTAYCNERGPR